MSHMQILLSTSIDLPLLVTWRGGLCDAILSLSDYDLGYSISYAPAHRTPYISYTPASPTFPHLSFPHFLDPCISYTPASPTSPHLLRTSRHVIYLRSYTPPSLHLRLPPSPTHRLASLPFSQPPSSPNFQAQPFTAAAITQWVTLRITPLLSIHIDYLPTHPPTTRNRLRLLRGCA